MKTVFYRAEQLAALRRKNRIWTVIHALVWLAALGLCLSFMLRRTTLNAGEMQLRSTLALLFGGWAAITVGQCAARYTRALLAHEERILASGEEPRIVSGSVTLEKKPVHVPRSIDVLGVRVRNAEGGARLLVCCEFAGALRKAAARGDVTLHAVEGYITEVETCA